MTTTPILGAQELVGGQAVPETSVNQTARRLEQGAHQFAVKDKDLATPPGTPADGDAYIVAAIPTGAWSGKAKSIAYWQAGTGWLFIAPLEGMRADVADEDIEYRYDGSAWVSIVVTGYTDENARDAIAAALVPGAGVGITVNDAGDTITLFAQGPAPSTQIGTSYTAALADAGSYIQFTNAAAVTFTIPPNSAAVFEVGSVITIEQNGAGAVTITPGAGVTLRSRGGLLSTAGQYAVAQIKKVATDTWTVIGDVA